jgi:hypothetical protein
MATSVRSKEESPAPRAKEWILPTRTLDEALALARRYQEAEGLRRYTAERARLLTPALAAIGLVGLACAAASMIFLAELHSALTLPALILAPFVLIGSLFVQMLVFFRWIEIRALEQALGRRPKPSRWSPLAKLEQRLGLSLGAFPPVPWIPAALFVAAPLAMLIAVSPLTAALAIAFGIGIPLLYAFFDR